MNKAELVVNVAQKVKSTKKDADKFVTATLDAILETLGKQEDIKLVGFGNFSVKNRASRKGRNPQTGEEIQIPAKKGVGFKPGKLMKDAVEGIGGE
jgi:DNA-binding protein HU-beta